jgi:hypothetical protein
MRSCANATAHPTFAARRPSFARFSPVLGVELPSIVPVEYRGGLVALVSARRIHVVAPWLLVRPAGDPELRLVAFTCLYAGAVLTGRIPPVQQQHG